MANQNIRVRITSDHSQTRHYYAFVGSGNGTNNSDFIFIGTVASGDSVQTSAEFSTGLLANDYGGYNDLKVYYSTTLDPTQANNGLSSSVTEYSGDMSGDPSATLSHPDASGYGGYGDTLMSNAYYVNITAPSSDSWGWGSWAQYDSSDVLIDTVGPSVISGGWSFPDSSSNETLQIIFDKQAGDSSGNLWTASTFPGFNYQNESNTTAENFGVTAIAYSTTCLLYTSDAADD